MNTNRNHAGFHSKHNDNTKHTQGSPDACAALTLPGFTPGNMDGAAAAGGMMPDMITLDDLKGLPVPGPLMC